MKSIKSITIDPKESPEMVRYFDKIVKHKNSPWNKEVLKDGTIRYFRSEVPK